MGPQKAKVYEIQMSPNTIHWYALIHVGGVKLRLVIGL